MKVDKKDRIKNAENLIISGRYEEAALLVRDIEEKELEKSLFSLAYDEENISEYSFVRYMIEKENRTYWIELAMGIMTQMSFIEGAYSIALFHARQLLRREPTVENMEQMLFFYIIPECLLARDEAMELVKQILEIKPNSTAAKEALKMLETS